MAKVIVRRKKRVQQMNRLNRTGLYLTTAEVLDTISGLIKAIRKNQIKGVK